MTDNYKFKKFWKNIKSPIWGLIWRNFAPKKCQNVVEFERLDQHDSKLFKTQLVKFQPK